MLNYYLDFLSHYALASDERAYLEESGKVLINLYRGQLEAITDDYRECGYDIVASKDARAALAELSGVNLYTVNFVVLACASAIIREGYVAKGYGEQLFYETFEDLFYKVRECKKVYGIYGIFVEKWYRGFFEYRIFKLGRLEFETRESYDGEDYIKNGASFKKGEPFISVHIPSSGPLTRESRYDSYRKAYKFFKDRVKDGKIVFTCHSWLLNAENYNVFPKGSNTYDFLSDWDIVSSKPDPSFGDCWRIFDMYYKGDPNLLPYDSSLRRAIVDHLKAGKHMGSGLGISIFDGDKKVN